MRLVLLALLLLPAATGHGDPASLIGEWDLAPGSSEVVERPVHWHRVMGQLESNQDIVFEVNGVVVAGPARDLTFDHLVMCCDDAVWTDVSFAVRNVGSETAAVRGDVAFLHDNLAVVGHGAEGGAGVQTLLIIGLMLGIPALRAMGSTHGDAVRWLRAGRITHAVAWGLALTMAAIGMIRFGTGPVVGSLGATAWIPGSFGVLFNTHSLLMLLAMALWCAAYSCHAGARRRGGPTTWDLYAFAAAPLLVGLVAYAEMGGWRMIPLAVLPALLVLTDLHGPKLYKQWTGKLTARGG